MVSINVNKILDSKATGLIVFGITGAAKMASDYKGAPDDNKNFVLVRDSLILGGAALGIGAYHLATSKLLCRKNINKAFKSVKNVLTSPIKKTGFYQNRIKPISEKYYNIKKTIGDNAEKIIHDCANNTMMLGCGIMGAVGADYAIQYSHIENNKRLKTLSQRNDYAFNRVYNYENNIRDTFINSRFNRGLEQAVGSDVKTNVYSRITDMPGMKMFSGTMVGVQGFEVIEQKTFKNRLKHATKCLVSNSLVPLFFLSTASCITKKLNPILRVPITFGALVGGTMYTNKLINKYEYSRKKTTPKEEKTAGEEAISSKETPPEEIKSNENVEKVPEQNTKEIDKNIINNEEFES